LELVDIAYAVTQMHDLLPEAQRVDVRLNVDR
jgi:hypothetical protein